MTMPEAQPNDKIIPESDVQQKALGETGAIITGSIVPADPEGDAVPREPFLEPGPESDIVRDALIAEDWGRLLEQDKA